MNAALVLVAAGQGARLGSPVPKAFLPLDGRPLFLHSLRTLAGVADVSRAIVVAAADRQQPTRDLVAQHGPWPVPVLVTVGGAERQDSVAAGLAPIADEDWVIVHDAARPFVSAACATACLQAAAHSGAAIAAIPATDTIKWAGPAGTIEKTLDRSRVWLAQTPQVFRLDLLRRAIATARASGRQFTDEATMLEVSGVEVHLVVGDPNNRKITTAADWDWAEWFVGSRA